MNHVTIETTFNYHNFAMNQLTHPKLFDGFNYEFKSGNNGKKRSWGALLGSQHFRGRGAYWSFEMGLGRLTSTSLIHMDLHKPNNKLVSA
jgi:hypothetical protein